MRFDRVGSLLLLLSLWFVPLRAQAASYDVIVSDSLDVTLCQGCGYSLGNLDYGLLVNTSVADITEAELRAATFDVVASRPEFRLIAFINIPISSFESVHPGEAVGAVGPGNEFLLSLLEPGETFRHPGGQFLGFQIDRGLNTYEGPVDFDVRMSVAGYAARFTLHVNARLGSHEILYRRGRRIEATPAGGPPNCAQAVAEPATLFPANRQFVPVAIHAITDPEEGPLRITLSHVTQDEPIEGRRPLPRDSTGQDSTRSARAAGASGVSLAAFSRAAAPQRIQFEPCADARIVDGQLELRAESDPEDNGRVYGVHYSAADENGNVCTGVVFVCVPGRDGQCVNDAQNYWSIQELCPPTGGAIDSVGFRARPVGPGVSELQFVLEEAAEIELTIFDVAGRRVETLERGVRPAGETTLRWTAHGARAGIYFARLQVRGRSVSRALVVR